VIGRRRILKTILWFFVGVLITVTVARFYFGLGATTALSDTTPWGLWIAFDVMSGVALAAGGFVTAAIVYIFGKQKYKSFARPAILTAFLGYAAVTVGLLYDLGIPINIWHPIIYQQYHSVLFEVGMCVMLYLTVLFLEFCPVILEHPLFNRPFFQNLHHFLKRFSIPLVIAGIVLSTLHQSSLGSLFLIAPYRVHPLWYSPIMWILFLISAIGLGLMVVISESLFSSWYFKHQPKLTLLSSLGKGASWILFFYAFLRLLDLAVRGQIFFILEGSWQSWVFIIELGLVILAAGLLSIPTIRNNLVGILAASIFAILGVIGYRFNVCIVAFARPTDMSYFPSVIEIVVTLGIVSSSILVFIFFVEHLKVFDHGPESEAETAESSLRTPGFNPMSIHSLLPESLSAVRRYSLAAIFGAALAFAFVSSDTRLNSMTKQTPVSPPLQISGSVGDQPGIPGNLLNVFLDSSHEGEDTVTLFVIDGNRDGRVVLFDHEGHSSRLGGDESCKGCHHQAIPFRKSTGCHLCHRDMFLKTDIFRHSSHVAKLDGNQGCVRCHVSDNIAKNRETAEDCSHCHIDFASQSRWIQLSSERFTGIAPGYREAMHGVCTQCHKTMVMENPAEYPAAFAECGQCHREMGSSYLKGLQPYGLKDSGI
jgi:Ni/Fe-hydrogenase subunit HybB-like protein